MSLGDPAETLRASSMFAGMSELELAAVGAFLEALRVPAGEAVFREGERGSAMYIVRSGRVAAFSVQLDGSLRTIGSYGPGDFFGEMAVIEDAPRSATCVAQSDVELLALEAIDFFRIVYEHPMIGLRMASAMVEVMAGWLSENFELLDQMARWGETARKRAITDSVTGLFNRRFLEEALAARLSRGIAGTRRCALIMMDIDGFHAVNAEFGQAAGDSTLGLVGALISGACDELGRRGAEAVAARLSGDEFAMLVSVHAMDDALAAAEGLRSGVQALPLEFRASPGSPARAFKISMSLGLAMADAGEREGARLFERADAALLSAKRGGRNRVEVFSRSGGR